MVVTIMFANQKKSTMLFNQKYLTVTLNKAYDMQNPGHITLGFG